MMMLEVEGPAAVVGLGGGFVAMVGDGRAMLDDEVEG